MTYPASAVLALAALLAGGALGNMLALLIQKILRAGNVTLRNSRWRFSLACVLMAGAVAVLAALLVAANQTDLVAFSLRSFRPGKGGIIFLAAALAVGALVMMLQKILLAPFALALVLLTLYTRHRLEPLIADGTVLTVSVESGSTKIGDADFSGKESVRIVSHRLPELLVVPVARNWYEIAPAKKGAKEPAPKTSVRHWKEKYDALLLENAAELDVPLPEESAFPSIYTLRFKDGSAEMKRGL